MESEAKLSKESSQSNGAGPLSVEELRAKVASGEIDTVVVAFPDMQGRLQGKRIHGDFFMEEVLNHGTEGCNYLLAVDVEMNTVGGYAMSSWDTGYGDFVMKIDTSTLRNMPWAPGSALVIADLYTLNDEPVAPAPRNILKQQVARLAERNMVALAGTELEFIVFNDTFEEAFTKSYRNLTPSNLYNVDYSLLGGYRVEPLLREIRLAMAQSGMRVESVKGECNYGQHEIAFKYDEVVKTCDNHSIYKHGSKDIAAKQGMSLTFMAKYNEREGNSCHIHLSVRGTDGALVMVDDTKPEGLSELGRSFIAGQIAHMNELTLLFAPNINSYKRYVEGSFAPTAITWGRDNRTCAFRLVGHGRSLRSENRVPGGDVNPYLAIAGMIAAGLDGVDKKMTLGPRFDGNAYTSSEPRVTDNLTSALELWRGSSWAREVFGAEVHDHYANMALVEIKAHKRAVTEWELIRNFERF